MFYHEKTLRMPFEKAVSETAKALQQHGFGVLTEIDLAGKLKEKTGTIIEPYKILGACHPPSAVKAVQAEQHIGLMLPCNVIVYQKDGLTHVASIRPTTMMGQIGNPNLLSVAQDVEKRLKDVVESVHAADQ